MATSSAALQLTRQLNRAYLPSPSPALALARTPHPRRVDEDPPDHTAVTGQGSNTLTLPPGHSLAELRKHPVEGFSAGLVDDDNVFEWEITIFGCAPSPSSSPPCALGARKS